MTGSALGGGLLFVVAALLWSAVLVPAWVRRREFRAAERNALRLQRTLRVLAETSEVPHEVHAEATAKEALQHEKMLRAAQRREEAERRAHLAEAKAEEVRAEIHAQDMQRKHRATLRAAKLRRPTVRRLRSIAALATLMGVIGVLVGAGLAIAGSGAAVLGWSALVGCAAFAGLLLMAPGRAKVAPLPVPEAVQTVADASSALESEIADVHEAGAESPASSAAHAAAQQAAAARIARARALARARAEKPATRTNQPDSMLLEEARRQARQQERQETSAAEPAVRAARTAPAAPAAQVPEAPERPAARALTPAQEAARAQQLAAAARLRQMGVVGDTSEGMPDLNALLQRRRNAG
ncbi:hypothetical protein [Leucobacter tardus]|uniref:Large exoprotein n=1 Tax=Leucobacter tardus TaxID=501483 RepID=A0A939QDR4_9MICO|nr:hypothetical protein [Leucobacter tardus]MBO2989283.1 hypothetical protein [Leucobacter tardus]